MAKNEIKQSGNFRRKFEKVAPMACIESFERKELKKDLLIRCVSSS